MTRARRIIAALTLAAMLVAAVAPAWAAATASLGIQQIDTADYPDVRLTVTLPADMANASGDAAFAVTENGSKAEVLSEERLTAPEKPIDVVLAIDTSGSMKGASLEAAKQAAAEFVDSLEPPSRIAIVAFNTSAKVVARFTDNDAALKQAISGLTAGGETAAYDALVASAGLAKQAGTNVRAIVLLSDGGDTMSRVPLDEAVRQVRAAGVPVYSVSLPSYEADPAVLKTIAAQTAGRQVAIKDITTLPALYRDIAKEIQASYVVVYRSKRPDTKDLEISIDAIVGEKSAEAVSIVPNPRFDAAAASTGDVLTVRPADYISLGFAVFLVWASAVLLIAGVAMIIARPRTALRQVEYYEQLRAVSGEFPTPDDATSEGLRRRMVGAVDYVAGRRGLTEVARRHLERAGMPLRPAEYMSGHIAFVITVSAAVQLIAGSLPLSIIVVVLTTAGPMLYIDYRERRRKTAFEEQLPEILNLIAGSLRAGWGMLQSVEMVVSETRPPASEEFRRVQTEARLGLPIEDALRSMAERVGSQDFAWAVSAIAIQREVGGNLAEVLDIVAATIRDRGALRRQVSALTAEGRLSAIILIALPFVEFIVLLTLNPSYMSGLLTSPLGLMLLGLGLLMLLIGSIWLTRAMKIEV